MKMPSGQRFCGACGTATSAASLSHTVDPVEEEKEQGGIDTHTHVAEDTESSDGDQHNEASPIGFSEDVDADKPLSEGEDEIAVTESKITSPQAISSSPIVSPSSSPE